MPRFAAVADRIAVLASDYFWIGVFEHGVMKYVARRCVASLFSEIVAVEYFRDFPL